MLIKLVENPKLNDYPAMPKEVKDSLSGTEFRTAKTRAASKADGYIQVTIIKMCDVYGKKGKDQISLNNFKGFLAGWLGERLPDNISGKPNFARLRKWLEKTYPFSCKDFLIRKTDYEIIDE